jgi:hypothetical protein
LYSQISTGCDSYFHAPGLPLSFCLLGHGRD